MRGAPKGNQNAAKKSSDKTSVQHTLRLKDEVMDWVEEQAELEQISKSKVIIKAVEEKMKREENDL